MTYKKFNKFCRALLSCLESRRQSLCNRRLAGGGAKLHLQGERYRLRDAEGAARVASCSLSCLARNEMDPAFRQARPVRRRAAGLYPPIACDCFAGAVEEEAPRAWAGIRAEMNAARVVRGARQGRSKVPGATGSTALGRRSRDHANLRSADAWHQRGLNAQIADG
jgi:hypothetical protein